MSETYEKLKKLGADAATYAAADARIKNQKDTADICRKYLPIPNF